MKRLPRPRARTPVLACFASAILTCASFLAASAQVQAQTQASGFPEVAALPRHEGFPDPLTLRSGQRVQTRDEWFRKRKPELQALFRHYMYGDSPTTPDRIEAKTLYENPKAFGGKVTLRETSLEIHGPVKTTIHLLTAVPNHRQGQGPVPAFVGPNFCGNHALVPDQGVRIPSVWIYPKYPGVVDNRATEAGRNGQADVWPIEKITDRGYALATFYAGDVATDQAPSIQRVRELHGESSQAGNVGMIAAWAWGVSRAVDHLIKQPEIDAKRIAVVGHSRMGKTALVAAAFDDRIALAIPHQAGCGGTAPSRGKIGESVQRINSSFPHWFNDRFKQFGERPDRLPFDQHELVALVAPRPVLFTNAEEDQWANPSGQFDVLKAASPVYQFLGLKGLQADAMPKTGSLLHGDLGYWIRPGKHSMTPDDWTIFLEFTDRHFR